MLVSFRYDYFTKVTSHSSTQKNDRLVGRENVNI